jgi:hypothetical protein
MKRSHLSVALQWFFVVPILTILSFHSANGAEAITISLQEIQDGIRQRSVQLGGIHAKFKHQIYDPRSPHDLILHYDYELYRDGSNLHFLRDELNRKSGVLEKKGEAAWNGQKATTLGRWFDSKKSGKDTVTGTIESQKSYAFRCNAFTAFEGSVFDADEPVIEWFAKIEWKALGVKEIGGRQAWGIANVENPRGIVLEVWVDAARDFAPLEMTITRSGPGIKTSFQKMTEVVLQRVKGMWVIQRAKIINNNPQIKDYEEQEETVQISEYDIRLKLPDETFVVAFPQDTAVWDDVIKTSYIVGRGVWVKDEKGVHHLIGEGGVLLSPEPREVSATAASSNSIGAWLWPTLGAACLLIVLLLMFHRRKQPGA